MASESTARRIQRGTLKSENWLQLLKFGLVGGSGYFVNLLVFAVLENGFGWHYILAAVGAFTIAVSNNFLWNRVWTFADADGHAAFQALRFFTVSVGALIINLVVLEALISAAGLSELPAQALAVAIAMPFNFIGNKLWTFESD